MGSPLDELPELIAHEGQLAAGMRHHIQIQCPHARELAPDVPRHAVDERMLAVHDLVVGKRKNEVLGKRIGHRKRQLILVPPPVDACTREIMECVMHPSHVPFVGEVESALRGLRGDTRPRGRLFRDHHRKRKTVADGRVEFAHESDRLEVLRSPIHIGKIFGPSVAAV